MAITTSPSGGPQGEFSTYTPIFSTTLTSAVVGVTFSNIPLTYTDLVIVTTAQSNVSGSDINNFRLQFNNDTSSAYSGTYLSGSGASVTSARDATTTVMYTGAISMTSSTSQAHSVIQVMNYSNGSMYKTVLGKAGLGTSTTTMQVGLWRNISPVTTVYLSLPSQTLNVGTTVTMYGIKGAVPAPKANGGFITTDGSYWYHAFKSTGIFEPTQAVTADILVVAGGGPGGPYAGGGGGAGGVLGFASQSLTANTSYTCLVGAGGGGAYNGQPSPKGNDSRFGSLTLVKGGGFGKNGGGVLFSEYENSGGSSGGGGGSGNAGQRTPQSATSGQGYSGGTASSSDSAGGGGAGAVGGGAVGAGGAGATYNTSIGGTSGPFAFINPMGFATGIGHYSGGNWYFGGGGSPAYTSNIAGGVGGGGSGAAYNVQGNVTTRGTDGMQNTGGGGGGGGASNNDATTRAMSGGSGVVIVRYAV